MQWHFIPTEMFPRKGLLVRDMNPKQRGLLHDLLKTALSQRGYLTATSIMDLETVLKALEAAQRAAGPQPPPGQLLERDPEKYFFSIFGTPTPTQKATWGWRVEGHHVSLHFTVVNGTLVASSPTFFGSNPAEVREGPKKGLRILGAEEDAARALLQSLDASQRTKAIINATAPGDMVTMNTLDISPLSPAGLDAGGDDRAAARAVDEAARRLHRQDGGRHRRGSAGARPQGRRREDRLRLGRRDRARQEALLPRAGTDLPDRVRQHAERRQPHPLGVARFQRRLRARSCCASTCARSRTKEIRGRSFQRRSSRARRRSR